MYSPTSSPRSHTYQADSPSEWNLGDAQLEEEEALISASVTDEQLATLAGTTELASVTFLQLAVDSTHVPLGTIGERLPALEQLKLSGSNMPCIRELGTSLGALRVLWLSRCGLADLDGLGALPQLSELYLAFNDVSRLMPLQPLEQLQVLDLEANNVTSMDEVAWLQFLPSLQELTLRANPVADDAAAADGAFAPAVFALLPSLATLDDETRDEAAASAAAPGGADAAAAVGWTAADDECPSPAAAAAAAAPPTPDDEVLRRRRAEEKLVAQAIKYAEVGRVYDVSADGRATLGATPGGGGVRPATACGCGDGRRRGSAPGSASSVLVAAARAGTTFGARPGSAFRPPATAFAAAVRPGTALLGGGGSWGSAPATMSGGGRDASTLTTGGEIICGAHRRRRHGTPPHPLPSALPHKLTPLPSRPLLRRRRPPSPQAEGVGARSRGGRTRAAARTPREQLVFVAPDARGVALRHAALLRRRHRTPGRGGDGNGDGRFRGGRRCRRRRRGGGGGGGRRRDRRGVDGRTGATQDAIAHDRRRRRRRASRTRGRG